MGLFSKNDWIDIEISCGYYQTIKTYDGEEYGKPIKRVTIFKIQYSKSRNKFRLEIIGNINEFTRDVYIKVLERLAELNRLLLTNNISKILENKIS